MEEKYRGKLKECFDILKNSEGLNYILCVCKATDPENEQSIGGHAWNITDVKDGESQPDFVTMIGGMIESYLSENNYGYIDKLKFINAMYKELLEHVTNGGERDEE